jgi:hypothetical protein
MKTNVRTLLPAVVACVMLMLTTAAMAQTLDAGQDAARPGSSTALERAGTIQRFGLDNAALKLTSAQKAEIDRATDAYVAEVKALNEQYPFEPGAPPSQESLAARMKAQETFRAAVSLVLNNDQKQIFQPIRRGPGNGTRDSGVRRGGPAGPGETPPRRQ